MSQRATAQGELVRYVYTREGSTPAVIPGEIARAITAACTDPDQAERALDFAGLVVVRLGKDAGTHVLRHWTSHESRLIRDADPVLAQVLATTPELITGALRA